MGELVLVGLVVLVVLGYVGSLAVHPRVKCAVCRGKGNHRGLIFSYADRACRYCKGTGRQERLGRRLFFRTPR